MVCELQSDKGIWLATGGLGCYKLGQSLSSANMSQ